MLLYLNLSGLSLARNNSIWKVIICQPGCPLRRLRLCAWFYLFETISTQFNPHPTYASCYCSPELSDRKAEACRKVDRQFASCHLCFVLLGSSQPIRTPSFRRSSSRCIWWPTLSYPDNICSVFGIFRRAGWRSVAINLSWKIQDSTGELWIRRIRRVSMYTSFPITSPLLVTILVHFIVFRILSW